MYPQKYSTLNLIINEIFSIELFPNYGILETLINCIRPITTGLNKTSNYYIVIMINL